MHLHFVFPRWTKLLEDYPQLQGRLSGYDLGSFRMAGLGIPAAAAALPAGHTVTVADENVAPVDLALRPDLVGISFFTPQAARAYEIADAFRARGVPVIGGGIHPTMAPDDARPHFDALVRGPVEGLWPELLRDAAQRAWRPVYSGGRPDLFPPPRRDLFAASTYLRAGIVQTARGCPRGCPFCVVPGAYGGALHFKPVPDVLDDIRGLELPCFYFADENLLFSDPANRAYTQALFGALRDARLPKVFFLAAYPFMLRDLAPGDIDLLAGAGCRQLYLILGLQDPLQRELRDPVLRARLQELRDVGVETMATFTLGHEEDPPATEPLILEFSAATRSNLAEFTLWTPYPGTPVFQTLEKNGLLLSKDWKMYNGAHVVFRPLHEPPEALQERYLALWLRFYGEISPFDMRQRVVKGFGSRILSP